jgi:hypothetical protein
LNDDVFALQDKARLAGGNDRRKNGKRWLNSARCGHLFIPAYEDLRGLSGGHWQVEFGVKNCSENSQLSALDAPIGLNMRMNCA